jgi:hypothetical protein
MNVAFNVFPALVYRSVPLLAITCVRTIEEQYSGGSRDRKGHQFGPDRSQTPGKWLGPSCVIWAVTFPHMCTVHSCGFPAHILDT